MSSLSVAAAVAADDMAASGLLSTQTEVAFNTALGSAGKMCRYYFKF